MWNAIACTSCLISTQSLELGCIALVVDASSGPAFAIIGSSLPSPTKMATALSQPEPMNAITNHSKVRTTLKFADSLFIAGDAVTGKIEMECRTDRGLGIGVIMVELFAIEGAYTHPTVTLDTETTKSSPPGIIPLHRRSCTAGEYFKVPDCHRPTRSILSLCQTSPCFLQTTTMPVEARQLSSSDFRSPKTPPLPSALGPVLPSLGMKFERPSE